MKAPPSQTIYPWLKANLGKACLAPLTSVDTAALEAATQIAAVACHTDAPEVSRAFGLLVRLMQPATRPLAFHAIAHVRDWSDRWVMWEDAGLGDLHCPLALYEPQALGETDAQFAARCARRK